MSVHGTADQSRSLPLREAADHSGLSVHVLRRHIRDGTLPAVMTGNHYTVTVADLDALPAKLQQIQEDREKSCRDERDAVINRIVDEFPPLSEDQKKELGTLLGSVQVPRPPIIPVTTPLIHPRPELPSHVHCGVCGKTWEVPVIETHLTYDKAVTHGENEHPEVDARLNVKPGKGKP
jgi:excisionase family DNA binding protein